MSAPKFADSVMDQQPAPESMTGYLLDVSMALGNLRLQPIARACEIIWQAHQYGRSIWIFGNGGSMALSLHFECDLRKWAKGIRAHALHPGPLFSALANDEGYEAAFVGMLRHVMYADDVAIGISCSGGSPNVVNALQYGKQMGKTIAILGPAENSPAASFADVGIFCGGADYRAQEDLHLIVCHMIAGRLREIQEATGR